MVPHRAVVNFLASMAREPGLTAKTASGGDHAEFRHRRAGTAAALSVGAKVVLATRDQALDGCAIQALIDSADITVMYKPSSDLAHADRSGLVPISVASRPW